MDHFKIFGYAAHAHIPSDERQKLDSKSSRCIFLGYGTEVKGYRLYDLQRSRVLFSRDVLLDECSLGMEMDKDSVGSHHVEIESDLTSNNDVPVIEQHTPNRHEESELRRSERVRRPTDRYGAWTNILDTEHQKDPVTMEDAISGPDKENWTDAMQEIQSIHENQENQVWDLVDLTKRKKGDREQVRVQTKVWTRWYSGEV